MKQVHWTFLKKEKVLLDLCFLLQTPVLDWKLNVFSLIIPKYLYCGMILTFWYCRVQYQCLSSLVYWPGKKNKSLHQVLKSENGTAPQEVLLLDQRSSVIVTDRKYKHRSLLSWALLCAANVCFAAVFYTPKYHLEVSMKVPRVGRGPNRES